MKGQGLFKNNMDILDHIRIDADSVVPKYLQLAQAILKEIQVGRLREQARLPSLHQCCVCLDISKNTIEKAYNLLRERGIVGAFRGKGYFVASEEVDRISLYE